MTDRPANYGPMRLHSLPRLFLLLSLLALLVLLYGAQPALAGLPAQEIVLEHCDKLPVIEVLAAGRRVLFLVDTAATSMLNLRSFTEGELRDLRIVSWNGTTATSALEVNLRELIVGDTKFVEIKLPAIDLSQIGSACGRRIDGILGVDLLARMGATIDLKRLTMRVATAADNHEAKLVEDMQRDVGRCLEAFNISDVKAFADCFDPEIVFSTASAELRGRKQVINYFDDRYFHQVPRARLDLRKTSFRAISEAVRYDYEFTIESTRGHVSGQGMAMWRKSHGRWRMTSVNHSFDDPQDTQVSSPSRSAP